MLASLCLLYIIYSKKLDRFYIGHTDNIETRLVQHNSAMSDFTSKANDWKLVYQESYKNRQEARHREMEIKKKKSRKYIQWLIDKNA